MHDLLIFAAFPPELRAFRDHFGGAAEGQVHGRHVAAVAVGIGLVSSAVGAARALGERNARAVVLVGTCGAYPASSRSLEGGGSAEGASVAEGLALGRVVRARRVLLADPGVALGSSAFLEPMLAAHEADAPMREGLSDGVAQEVDVATTLAVTTDDPLAALLGDASGCQVEHLEAAAVATACAAEGVRFAAVFGVANAVGSRGREQWRAGHQGAGDAAVRHVLAWLARGAPGL